jgi:hypothetical protein
VNKKNVLSLALSLAALVLWISPEAVAHTPHASDGHEAHRAQKRTSRRRSTKRRKSAQTREATYTCPMHPDIHEKSPGECPKCGMELDLEKPAKAKSE